MKIGELAKTTGCPVETIRYYERSGLLSPPARSDGNYRRYAAEAVERLAFIRRCRSLDMSLDEIRTLLQVVDARDASCQSADATIDAHIAHVGQRLRELRTLQQQLRAIRSACTGPGVPADCGILNRLRETADAPGTRGSGHVAGTHGRTPSVRAPRLR